MKRIKEAIEILGRIFSDLEAYNDELERFCESSERLTKALNEFNEAMKNYKGIPLAKCPHNRDMTDEEILKAMCDGFKMLQADGWNNGQPPKDSGDEWKEGK